MLAVSCVAVGTLEIWFVALLLFQSCLGNLSIFADTDKNKSENAAVSCFLGDGISVIHPNLFSVLASYMLLLAMLL